MATDSSPAGSVRSSGNAVAASQSLADDAFLEFDGRRVTRWTPGIELRYEVSEDLKSNGADHACHRIQNEMAEE